MRSWVSTTQLYAVLKRRIERKKFHLRFPIFSPQIRNSKGIIMQDLENSLAQQAPPTQADVTGLHDLPPLVIDGIPTPVDKMTQVLSHTGKTKIYLEIVETLDALFAQREATCFEGGTCHILGCRDQSGCFCRLSCGRSSPRCSSTRLGAASRAGASPSVAPSGGRTTCLGRTCVVTCAMRTTRRR